MPQTVLITGASGYVGSHVCDQLLAAGFRVRATARADKVDKLRKSFTSHSDRFEVVEMHDITKDDFSDVLKGVFAVVHVALYFPSESESPEKMITGTIDSAVSIVKQAEAAGVKHIVVTGTVAAVMNAQGTFNHDGMYLTNFHNLHLTFQIDWNPVTKEAALESKDYFAVYAAAKKYSELAVWDWAEAYPNVEVTVLCPAIVFGPWPSEFYMPTPNFGSTTIVMWNLLKPEGQFGGIPYYIDVRDLAKAHVRAITHSAPTSKVGRKRLVFSSPHTLDWEKAVNIVKENRPQLADRVIKKSPYKFPPRPAIDFGRVEEVLGMKPEDFHTFEETILDSIDNCLDLEKEWISAGYEVSIPKVDPLVAAPESEKS